jgi:hypothetical protein
MLLVPFFQDPVRVAARKTHVAVSWARERR